MKENRRKIKSKLSSLKMVPSDEILSLSVASILRCKYIIIIIIILKGKRGYEDLKIVYISIFSQFQSRGGVFEKSIFSQIQNSPNYPGGVKKIMDFFHNLWHFCFDGSS